MTTINCSSNCIHQKDGLCTLENAATNSSFTSIHCIYYEEKVPALSRSQNDSKMAGSR